MKDVASADFVIAYAAHLKRIGKIEVPKWADLVKTATYKELAPYDPDWYYIRAGERRPRAARLQRAVGSGPALTARARGHLPRAHCIPLRACSCHGAPCVLEGGCGRGRFQEDLRRAQVAGHDQGEVLYGLWLDRAAHPEAARGAQDCRESPRRQGVRAASRRARRRSPRAAAARRAADRPVLLRRRRITPQGQRDLDSIAGQIGCK